MPPRHFTYGKMMNMIKKYKLPLLRVILGILIVLNMLLIFNFSNEDGATSNNTSTSVSQVVAENTVPDFNKKPVEEQTEIVQRINKPLRKIAHMTEFGSLGALVFFFLLTWKGHLLLRYISSLVFTFLYACTDEWHQSFTASRGARFTDILIDFSGAVITCSVILGITLLILHNKHGKVGNMQTTHYHIPAPRADVFQTIAVASDLHNCDYGEIIDRIKKEAPDLILIPGDLMDDEELRNANSRGYGFLRECAKIAPTYYSLGNHEIRCYHKGNPWRHPLPVFPDETVCERIRQTGVTFLQNESVRHGELRVCGLTSGINGKKNEPDADTLEQFSNEDGIKLLLCHHPEYFYPYIQKTNVDLTVCGHAHGGQWRIFGRGVYAPGQGLFPKYTSGVLENRCVISRGLGNHTWIPRIFNKPELVVIHWDSKQSI